MAIDMQELKTLYDEMLTKGMDALVDLQKKTQMEDEYLAKAASDIINKSFENSIGALEFYKRAELIDKQILTEGAKKLDIESSTASRNKQSAKDLLVKDAQITEIGARKTLVNNQASTELKKALDITSITTVRNTQSAKDAAVKDAQVSKMAADTLFVTAQENELKKSVIFNNKLKALQNYSDTLGNMGIGGFVIDVNKWKYYFEMIVDIYDSNETAFSKPADTDATAKLTKA